MSDSRNKKLDEMLGNLNRTIKDAEAIISDSQALNKKAIETLAQAGKLLDFLTQLNDPVSVNQCKKLIALYKSAQNLQRTYILCSNDDDSSSRKIYISRNSMINELRNLLRQIVNERLVPPGQSPPRIGR